MYNGSSFKIERMFLLIKFNLRKLLIIAMISVLALGLFGCTKNTEGLVAKVNGEDITQQEFDADYQVFKDLYERQLGEDALEQVGSDGKAFGETLKESILEKLIMEKLIAKQSIDMNLTVSEEEVATQMTEYIAQMEGQENFDEFLTTNNLTKEFFELNMKKELLVEKHKTELLNNITISDEDASKYFEDNKENLVVLNASHILVATEEEGNSILEKLKNGEDFATLATLESLDSVSAAKGGELGYFSKGQMIAEFEDAAFDLEEGETSKLVKTVVGYHIIKLVEKKDTFEELKDDIKSLMKEEQYLKKVQEIRDDAKVEKYLETSK